MDIDPLAVREASARLPSVAATKLDIGNALLPRRDASPVSGWDTCLRAAGMTERPGIIIANPPWGADLSADRDDLMQAGYTLAKGQFDSYELFIELSLDLLKPDGFYAFIVPDSIFATEHAPLRRLLLTRTQLLFVARLGEGLFDSVFRGCAVVVGRNCAPADEGITRCMRLTPPWRRWIALGEADFLDAEAALSHEVRTSRFLENRDALIDLDATDADSDTLRKLRTSGSTVADYLASSRGVELSKYGKVVHCPACGMWSPKPKDTRICPSCNQTSSPLREDVMVSAVPLEGYVPFIVGEDVGRHSIRASRWIDLDREGINYKSAELYEGAKLLVRKTGVGISAAMDYSGAYTNQVVYVFKRNAALPEWVPIEFAAALICSRAAYYHLVKTHGETEWRSHPYVTQKHILNLPAPRPDRIADYAEKVMEAAALIRNQRDGHNIEPAVDAVVERLVADVFGLSREDYEHIFDTLYALQDLLPVRALKSITVGDIF